VEARFSVPVLTCPGSGSLSWEVKRSRRGFNQPPPSSAEVEERIELYLYSHSGPSWSLVERILPLPLLNVISEVKSV
jgi:hypothetical protein